MTVARPASYAYQTAVVLHWLLLGSKLAALVLASQCSNGLDSLPWPRPEILLDTTAVLRFSSSQMSCYSFAPNETHSIEGSVLWVTAGGNIVMDASWVVQAAVLQTGAKLQVEQMHLHNVVLPSKQLIDAKLAPPAPLLFQLYPLMLPSSNLNGSYHRGALVPGLQAAVSAGTSLVMRDSSIETACSSLLSYLDWLQAYNAQNSSAASFTVERVDTSTSVQIQQLLYGGQLLQIYNTTLYCDSSIVLGPASTSVADAQQLAAAMALLSQLQPSIIKLQGAVRVPAWWPSGITVSQAMTLQGQGETPQQWPVLDFGNVPDWVTISVSAVLTLDRLVMLNMCSGQLQPYPMLINHIFPISFQWSNLQFNKNFKSVIMSNVLLMVTDNDIALLQAGIFISSLAAAWPRFALAAAAASAQVPRDNKPALLNETTYVISYGSDFIRSDVDVTMTTIPPTPEVAGMVQQPAWCKPVPANAKLLTIPCSGVSSGPQLWAKLREFETLQSKPGMAAATGLAPYIIGIFRDISPLGAAQRAGPGDAEPAAITLPMLLTGPLFAVDEPAAGLQASEATTLAASSPAPIVTLDFGGCMGCMQLQNSSVAVYLEHLRLQGLEPASQAGPGADQPDGSGLALPLWAFGFNRSSTQLWLYNCTLELPQADFALLSQLVGPPVKVAALAASVADPRPLPGITSVKVNTSLTTASQLWFNSLEGYGVNMAQVRIVPQDLPVPSPAVPVPSAGPPTAAPPSPSSNSGSSGSSSISSGAVAGVVVGAVVGTACLAGLAWWAVVASRRASQGEAAGQKPRSKSANSVSVEGPSPSAATGSASASAVAAAGREGCKIHQDSAPPGSASSPSCAADFRPGYGEDVEMGEPKSDSLLLVGQQGSCSRRGSVRGLGDTMEEMPVKQPGSAGPSPQPRTPAGASGALSSSTSGPSHSNRGQRGRLSLSQVAVNSHLRTDPSSYDSLKPSIAGSSEQSSSLTKTEDPMDQVRQMIADLDSGKGEGKLLIQECIGQGGYGTVHRGLWCNMEVAVKTMLFSGIGGYEERDADGQLRQRALREAAVCSSVWHPNVVATYHYDIVQVLHGTPKGMKSGLQISQPNLCDYKLYLIQEFCHCPLSAVLDSGCLHAPDGTPVPDMLLAVLLDVAYGMVYLHSRNIVHGDLTPANILLKTFPDGFIAKITDFGLCELLEAGKTHVSNHRVGTPFYVAPEVAANSKLTKASDVFSFGIIMVELYTGMAPFCKTSGGAYERNPTFGDFSKKGKGGGSSDSGLPPSPGAASPLLPTYQAVAMQCMAREPQERPTFQEVVENLQGMAKRLPSFSASSMPTSSKRNQKHKSGDSAAAATAAAGGGVPSPGGNGTETAEHHLQQQGQHNQVHAVQQQDERPPSSLSARIAAVSNITPPRTSDLPNLGSRLSQQILSIHAQGVQQQQQQQPKQQRSQEQQEP